MSYAVTAPINPFGTAGAADIIRRGVRVLYLHPVSGNVSGELRNRLGCPDTIEDVLFGRVSPQSGFGWNALWVMRRGANRWDQLGWLWGSPYEAGRLARVASACPSGFTVALDTYAATDLAGGRL